MRLRDAAGKLVDSVGLLSSYVLRTQSGLSDAGWFRSFRERASVDKQGNPIPWISYPALAFLGRRVPKSVSMFEYGSGNSTLYWAPRVATLVACEHDAAWLSRMSERLPPRVRLIAAEPSTYAEAIGTGPYDVVVVDGIERPACIARAVTALSPQGVLIVDDTDRTEYEPALAALHGFRRVDFWGMKPIEPKETCTSVLYRHGNCLGL